MGTHPSGPSMIEMQEPWHTTTPLSEWLKLNQPRLASSLPFLFKLLSVRTALSIQAHPDKKLAERLHAAKPDKYKDDNHKPEMCVAITRYEALCNFQSGAEILANLRNTPELAAVVGEATISELDAANSERSQGASTPRFKAALKGVSGR